MRFKLWEDFLALVLPVTCVICRQSLYSFEDHICRSCEVILPLTSYHLTPEENDLKQKIVGLAEVKRVMAFLRFAKKGKAQKILHHLKYRNKPHLGNTVGKLYGRILAENGFNDTWDLIVPVPLHEAKMRKRGYNQSECFADGLGNTLNVPVEMLLRRTVNTSTQTRKNRLERWENVSDVFQLSTTSEPPSGKRILLVDDVMTTGATLAACVKALHEAKPESVDIAVIAAGS